MRVFRSELNERMTAGVLLQYVQSTLETYTSSGMLIDAGYHLSERRWI